MTQRHSGLVVALMTAGSIGLLASPALAQDGDRDCPGFPSQQAAQRFFQSQAGDPDRLDADDDGIACETFFGGGRRINENKNMNMNNKNKNMNMNMNNKNKNMNMNMKNKNKNMNMNNTPSGGVAAGAGGTAGPSSPVLPATGALAGTVLIVAGVAAARRRTS